MFVVDGGGWWWWLWRPWLPPLPLIGHPFENGGFWYGKGVSDQLCDPLLPSHPIQLAFSL